ncbi:hypothetical protein G3580_06115 [Nitrogeniibacter mangrovi]|uniref:Flagellar hook-length control protein-like C-terminal domain-containing protein n=1 Tax=Nitrogeniibacter mangrovi TaxID=2016596 RepID=A0A6C1B0W9_9RHOO|nr:flagellar hook-length control protein FliK [Nitrogeniibacter mangrovi]QID17256.1 hypothetical protein G3580_06115 [Nitrogeniibacter mangrovi]
MAAMVKQTLTQMLQATPTPSKGAGARGSEGNGATQETFSNTLERKMAAPERPPEARAQARQNADKPQENQPVQDKAPESAQTADAPGRDEAPAADGKQAQADGDTKAATKDTQASDDSKTAAAADAATSTTPAADPAVDPATVIAAPAAVAATPAKDAALPAADANSGAAVAATASGNRKATTVVDLTARVSDDAAKTATDPSGDRPGKDAGLTGAQARAADADTNTDLRTKPAPIRDGIANFAAQLDKQLGTAKPGDAIQMNTPGAASPGVNAHAALAAAAPSQTAQAARLSQPVLPTHLGTPVDSADWPDAVGNRVMWMAGKDESRAELILTPPSLGKLEISLHMSGDTTTAHFTAATPAAREALEQAMPRLREMLEQAGVMLADSNVNTAPQDQPGERGQGGQFHGGRHGAGGELAVGAVGTPAGHWISRGEGMIDTFA